MNLLHFLIHKGTTYLYRIFAGNGRCFAGDPCPFLRRRGDGHAQSRILEPRVDTPWEKTVKPEIARVLRHLQRNILAGIITIGPLFVTYLIFSFLLETLAKAGLPMVHLFAAVFPSDWLSTPWLQSVLAVVLTLVVLYVVGPGDFARGRAPGVRPV